MKKSIVFLIVILGVTIIVNNFFLKEANAQKGIYFDTNSFDKLLIKAKNENKLIFVDCYTVWCGPCKWMVKNVFTNDTVGDFFNSNFICVKMDMEKEKGPEFTQKYEINCYPTYIFLNGDGKLIHRVSGAFSIEEFIDISKNAINPEKQYSFFKDKYDSGEISRQELISLMKLRQNSCLSFEKEVETYFKNFKSEPEYASLDWSVIKDFGLDINSPTFKFLVTNKEIFYNVYTEDSVNEVIGGIYLKEMYKCFSSKKIDTTRYISLRSDLINLNLLPQSHSLVALADFQFYKVIGNWKKFANSAIFYVDNYLPKNENEFYILNDLAWDFYEHIDAIIYLDIAIGWVKRSIELHQDYYNTDTYAHLLYKRGKKVEAQTMAEKAIELGKVEKTDVSDTEVLLKKIKAMK